MINSLDCERLQITRLRKASEDLSSEGSLCRITCPEKEITVICSGHRTFPENKAEALKAMDGAIGWHFMDNEYDKIDCHSLVHNIWPKELNDMFNELRKNRFYQHSQLMASNIEDTNMSIRTINALKRHGIDTVQELLEQTQYDIDCIKGIGPNCSKEIGDFLSNNSLSLRKNNGETNISS